LTEQNSKVQQWFKNATEILEINIQEVSNLKSLDYKALNVLKKENWKKMSPDYGHILFNMWQKDQRSSAKTVGTEEYHEGI
jgi:hypothetical protein